MQAVAVFPESKDIRLVETERPDVVRTTDVLVRILEVGVCGTDREICGFHYGEPPAGSEFLIIGHEALGRVERVGSAVTSVRAGDLVALTVRRACDDPSCAACAEGRQDFCFSGRFTERGIRGRHGFMTQWVVDEERNLVRVPESLRDVAALIEPLTIAEKAIIEVWQIQQRLPWQCPDAKGKKAGHCHHALVLGAGPIGMLGAMALSNAGFSTFVYSREPDDHPKAQIVRKFGATYLSATTTPLDQLSARIGTIDVVYEATGASSMAFHALPHIGPNAVFVFTGVPGLRAPVPVDTDRIMRGMVLRNQVLLGTVNAGRDAFEAAVRDLAEFRVRWPGVVESLITRRWPLSEFRSAIGATDGIKEVIVVG